MFQLDITVDFEEPGQKNLNQITSYLNIWKAFTIKDF